MVSLSIAGEYFAGLVHPSVAGNEVAAGRHRSFIASHLLGGMLAFAAMPLILLARGAPPHPVEIAAFAWLVAPIFAAMDLARTGNLERAQIMSIGSLAGLVLVVSALTGGVHSFAMVWLPVVIAEAAFSESRRVKTGAVGLVVLVLSALLMLDAAIVLPIAEPNTALFYVSVLSAALYTAGLAIRWDGVRRALAGTHRSVDTRYRLVADHITDLVTCHTRSGGVLFASPAAEQLLRVKASELAGRGMFDRVHITDRPAFLTALSATNGNPTSIEFRIKRAPLPGSGSGAPEFIWVEMRCRFIGEGETAGANGEHVICVIREVTDRKEHERELREAREEADRANAAKSRFLASISHELRTPLNAIIGFSELLANGDITARDPHRQREYAGLIHDSGLHLLSVVNGILDMSRIESGNFSIVAESFAIHPVIDSCLQLFALKAAEAGIKVDAHVPPSLPELVADKRAYKQILINLLSNAIKFTPKEGRVAINARVDGDFMRLEVADTGVGVDADDLPMLGNSFFQARSSYDRPYEGTGLGLSVVKGLIELHGGTFEVQSRVNEGTRVIVRLPLDCRPAGRYDEPPQKLIALDIPQRKAANG